MKDTFLSLQGVLLAALALVAITAVTAFAFGATSDDPSLPPASASATVADETAGSDIAASDDAPAPPTTEDSPAATGLTDDEASGILFMREEEKLAYDVYVTLGDMWGQSIFSNIASAELTHMDAVLGLIETYGLDDPMDQNDIGVFENHELQSLYDTLIETGSESITAALEVGAIIEEVDIVDLEGYLADTTNPDIIRVYENLLRGSRNHLRAFVSQLEAAGIDREPYVMDTEAYELILSTDTERGGSSRGAGNGGQHGKGHQG
ncbi:MAG: DUF2202 domain-containing protein [Actinomycetota bacterium]